jgi:hypothetical protein
MNNDFFFQIELALLIFKKYQYFSSNSSIISNIKKVNVLAIGFLINRGAKPFVHPPSFFSLRNSAKMR